MKIKETVCNDPEEIRDVSVSERLLKEEESISREEEKTVISIGLEREVETGSAPKTVYEFEPQTR